MISERLDEEAIFKAACRIEDPKSRADYLQQTCGDDQELYDRVSTLLRVHDEEPGFLEAPAAGIATNIDVPPAHDLVGTQIGPYKLREQIGEGGFGVVYVAEQKAPVARKVALKIIKPGMDTKDVIARFEAERQALALMNHPNVATVLDAGATESGRPYFVMELVNGVPITTFSDDQKLSTHQRLKLFLDVCRAIQHAHQKGIIHRDLKPSNVMVTMHGDKSVVKVIDFGVAKALSSKLTEKTVYTAYGQMVGTPMYMSPEQAQLSGLDVDTRSDVYSLGVLLYELLTGATPFDKETLTKVGFDEMRRIICEDEPPRPSTRVNTLNAEARSTISDRRKIEPRKIGQSLRGELDWIVMKALEKDRNRRYESSSAFAADIERFLKDEPVHACPPSVAYRLRKYARRHKPLLTTAALLLATLLVATGVSISYAIRAEKSHADADEQKEAAINAQKLAENQRQIAEKASEDAQRFADQSNALARFLVSDVLGSTNPDRKDEWTHDRITVSEVLLRAERKIADAFPDDPILEAWVCQTIGNTFRDLHLHACAERLFHCSFLLRAEHLGRVDADTVRSAYELARTWCVLGETKACSELCRECLLPAQESLGTANPSVLALMNQLAITTHESDESERLCQLVAGSLREQEADNYDAVVLNDAAAFLATAPDAAQKDLELAIHLVKRAIAKERGQRAFSRTLAIAEQRLDHTANVLDSLFQSTDGNGGIRLNPSLIPRFRLERETAVLEELLNQQMSVNASARRRLLLMRAHLRGRARRWRESLEDLREVVRLDPNRIFPDGVLACVLYQIGDIRGCRQVCLDVSDRFPDRQFTTQYQVFLPNMVDDYTEILKVSNLTSAREQQHGFSRAMHGLVLYRAGRMRECLNWLDPDVLTRDQIREGPDNPYPAIMSRFIIAMAHAQLGQSQEACQAFDGGTSLLEERSQRSDLGDQWYQWGRCKSLFDEAKILLGNPSTVLPNVSDVNSEAMSRGDGAIQRAGRELNNASSPASWYGRFNLKLFRKESEAPTGKQAALTAAEELRSYSPYESPDN